MIYDIEFSKDAHRHLDEWMKSGQKKILKKIFSLLDELREHPTTGTGQVEQLKGDMSGYWSRRIDKSSRMIYTIEDEKVIVTVVSLKGHYGDK
ncbi:MAG: Txe/YoeB family addiction module toxin [Lachnospiraceae bacterium]|nr:Txe/YoeB family addiction module toxin [Lachnospiraceae bacterium]